MTVKIVTDSGSDLRAATAAEHRIEIVPLTVRFGDEEFTNLAPSDFWSRCAKSAALPETAAPAPGAFEQAFRQAADAGADGVVCVVLSTKLSATGQSASAAAQAVAGQIPVRIVDSRSVSLGLGLVAVGAAEAAATGATLDEVTAVAEDLTSRTHLVAALDTLENLKKGGRIGGAKALLGSLLSIKPIIEVKDGAVEPGPKQRTRSRALQFLVDQVAAHPKLEKVAVLHADAPDVDAFVQRLSPYVDSDKVIIGDVGAVIGTHSGPGAIGVVIQDAAS